ncbi:MAG: hypothetical protein IJ366_03505, partial [Clostridia bacterium]|nr:hypothetical protein [Clostridia bacterium]
MNGGAFIIKRISALLTACFLLITQFGCSGNSGGEIIIEEGVNEINMSVCGVDTFNPLKTQSESVSEMLTLVYEPLFGFDEALMPIPILAEGITVSTDRLTAKVSLSNDVLWHSGAVFTAEDVVYTVNEIKKGGTVYDDNVAQIASATVDTDGGVLLALTEPVMNIEGLLSFPIIRNGSAVELDDKPDGTGVFYVSEKTAHEIILLPNKNSEGSVSSVRVRVMRSEAACVNAFEMRELDLITSSVVDLGEKTPAGEIQTQMCTSNRMTFLGFNCRAEKYTEPYFRLAVSNIVDRSELVEKAMFGKAAECKLPVNPQSTLYSVSDGLELDID